ncbi:MAG: gluconokinase [Steroidobacteraceae bacterium]
MTRTLVVMGVSGCGKTTLARALAAALGWDFVEGDTLHPEANLARMAAGIPLGDADRQPFLERVADALRAGRPRGVVVTCSALKRRYRDLIRARAGDVRFVLPVLDRARIAARLALRRDHFMPAALLDSQFADFEPPAPDERVVEIDGGADTGTQVGAALAALRAETPLPPP